MAQQPIEEPSHVQRVFGFFVFVVAVGLAYSLIAPRGAGGGGSRTGLASADDVGSGNALAYAACQDGVRARSIRGAQVRFPEVAESFGRADSDQWAIVSRVVVAPRAGSPFAQRFACRVSRIGVGPASVWRVSRLSLEMPEA